LIACFTGVATVVRARGLARHIKKINAWDESAVRGGIVAKLSERRGSTTIEGEVPKVEAAEIKHQIRGRGG